MVIYKVTNLLSGKIYVGKDLHNNSEYFGSGLLIKQALRKYGKKNFKKEIIEKCNKSEGNEREVYWIKKFSSTDRNIGYNITEGGEGGDHFTNNPRKEEIREVMRKRFIGEKNPMFGKTWPEERKKRVRKKLLGRKDSINTLKKKSKASKGENNGMFGVHGHDHPNYGKELPISRKEKISASLLEYWRNHPEKKEKMSGDRNPAKKLDVRKKISESLKGKPLSEEHKFKLSKCRKGKPGSNKGRCWSKETKIKISESLKERFKKRKEGTML